MSYIIKKNISIKRFLVRSNPYLVTLKALIFFYIKIALYFNILKVHLTHKVNY